MITADEVVVSFDELHRFDLPWLAHSFGIRPSELGAELRCADRYRDQSLAASGRSRPGAPSGFFS
jgi:hypothetical protein